MNVGDEVVYLILDERFAYIRLFQQVEKNQSKIELHDVSIRMRFTSYRNTNRESRIRLLTGVNNNVLTHTQITPLRESFIFKVFIVEVCDRDTALNRNPTIGDIIVDGDIQYLKFREYLNPVLATEIEISCDGCQFQHHEIVMCLELNKLKICLLENDENDVLLFNKGNYALVFFCRLSQLDVRIQTIKEGIEKEDEIDRLRDFQFWYQQITNSNISEILQNRLHEKRRQRFDELEYNRKFNEFVEQIRQETDLNRLKNEWITKIDKSKFNDEDKNTLYDLREERIQELQPNESDDYQRI
ncbi:hypothetical protein C2G38_2271915 [Gigaspora rosea]|uniref:Uncharacterized protein n=1 Tax=Gigaspora rosea TaxID=44941 RepID=A0A397UD88_9GLOM|nr:hypothetical protein C2G38_2271915 [Gigaspora rosea]